jgi:putative membrane protein
MGGLFADPSPFRRVLQKVTAAAPAWLYVVAATWIWHDGKMYDLALRSEVVHDLEHLTFFVAGMIFFWHVVGSAPHIHHTMGYLQRAAYVVSEVPANMLLGVSIAFAAQPLFAYYTTVPRVWGISVMDDQRVGGIIMWILGSMMYLMVALVLIAQFLRGKDDEAPLSEKGLVIEQTVVVTENEG